MHKGIGSFLFIMCFCFFSEASPFVHVRSQLFDIGRGQYQTVSGVGFIVAEMKDHNGLFVTEDKDLLNAKYYVVTAGHVSKGLHLQILSNTGEQMPIKSVIHSDTNDLSLLEIDNPLISGPEVSPYRYIFKYGHPLIEVKKIFGKMRFMTSLSDRLEIPMGNSFPIFSTNHQGSEDLSVLGIYIESEDFVRSKIDYSTPISMIETLKNSVHGTSSLLVAPWLEDKVQKTDLNEKRPFSSLDRDRNVLSQKGPFAFQVGFSGSPVLIARNDKRYQWYELGGVLVSSVMSDHSSVFAAEKALRELFAARGKRVTESTFWSLYGQTFIRFSNGKSEVFLNQGPVGNGINVDGAQGVPMTTEMNQGELSLKLKKIGYSDEAARTISKELVERLEDQSSYEKKEQQKVREAFEAIKKMGVDLKIR